MARGLQPSANLNLLTRRCEMDYKSKNLENQRGATRADRRKAAGVGACFLVTVTKTASPLFEVVSNDGEILQFEQRENGTLKTSSYPPGKPGFALGSKICR